MKKMKQMPVLLIAEDDPDDQLLIRSAVAEMCTDDLDLQFVENGFELMARLKGSNINRRKPNLLILDLNMPGKDGRTALKEMKSDPSLLDIPVVVLTTSTASEDFQYCQKQGVTGFYRKPNTISGLEDIFYQLCDEYL